MFKKLKYVYSRLNYELIIWVSALIYFFFLDPHIIHYSFCLFNQIGLGDYCPGCGLGRSISYFLHFDLQDSLSAHPLGIIIFFILLYRIYKLVKYQLTKFKGARQW